MKEGGGAKMAEYVSLSDGTNSVKLMVQSNNQICLNGVCEAAERLKQESKVSSGSRVNHNGGFLMHFPGSRELLAVVEEIANIAMSADPFAKVTAFNLKPID